MSFWTTDTKLSCWYCTESCNGPPFPQPLRRNADHWVVQGVFCSLNCVKAHIVARQLWNFSNSFSLLTRLAQEVYGVEGAVEPAPDVFQRAKFAPGPGLSLVAWRAGLKWRRPRLVRPPPFRLVGSSSKTPNVTKDLLK